MQNRVTMLLALTLCVFSKFSVAQRPRQTTPKPATLPCGSVNPHIQYMVTSDTGTNKSGTLDRIDTVSAGDSLRQTAGDGWPSNGQGAANATINTVCTLVFPGDEENVYTRLNLTTAIFAQSGCCGGLQPGGQAYAQPEWQSLLLLPGLEDDNWSLNVTLNTSAVADWAGYPKPSGNCTISIDGETAAHNLDVSQPSSSFSVSLNSGPHALAFQCPQYGLNVRGAGVVVGHNVSLEQTLYVRASKSSGQGHAKAK